jgi:hypothetical protein
MAAIRSLRPNVSREEAVEQFAIAGFRGILRETLMGPLRSVADFYIPFQLFQIEVTNRGKTEHRIWGVDAVNGSLDPYLLDGLPSAREVICLETRNSLDPLLDSEQARELVVSKVQRLLFSTGFLKLRGLEIHAEAIPGEICVPYWVGFHGRGKSARFTVIDAVRRRREGARVRHLLRNWLTSGVQNIH